MFSQLYSASRYYRKPHRMENTPITTVRLPEERERVRTPEGFRTEIKNNLINLCRLGARKDGVRVLLERTDKRGNRTPVLDIDPIGRINEVLAPRLYTTIRERLTALFTDPNHCPNQRAVTAYGRLTSLVATVDREITDDRRKQQDYKRKKNAARRERQEARKAAGVSNA